MACTFCALIEHQGQLGRGRQQPLQPLAQRREHRGKRAHVGPGAFVEDMPQRQLAVFGDDQRQAQLPQVVPPLLVVAAGGEVAVRVCRRQMGEEIRRVVRQQRRPHPLTGQHLCDQPVLRLCDRRHRHRVHLIPEVLTGQCGGIDAQPRRQAGASGPGGHRALTRRVAHAGNRGGRQRLPDRHPVPSLHGPAGRANRRIEHRRHVKLLDEVHKGIHCADRD